MPVGCLRKKKKKNPGKMLCLFFFSPNNVKTLQDILYTILSVYENNNSILEN